MGNSGVKREYIQPVGVKVKFDTMKTHQAFIVLGLNYNPTTRKLLFLRVNVNATVLFD